MAAALATAPPIPHNYRTVECRHFLTGTCNKGDACTFKHTIGADGLPAAALGVKRGREEEGSAEGQPGPQPQELRIS